jgi:DNA-binding MarR family transcriptional regulator
MTSLSALFGQAVAGNLGIHHTDMETLDMLNLFGPMSPGRLSELTGLSSGATTRLIDRLEAAGYAHRVPDPSDRRRLIVEPLPSKMAAAMMLFAPVLRRNVELWMSYSEEELAVIVDFLRRTNEIMFEENARVRREMTGD